MSLIDYAKTDRQREAMKAWQDCGEVVAKAAGVLGFLASTCATILCRLKTAAAAGYSQRIGMQDATFLKARLSLVVVSTPLQMKVRRHG
jgi:hypothetical protein